MSIRIPLLAAVTVTFLLLSSSGARAFSVPPSVTVDLDGNATARWHPAIDAVMARHGWDNSFGALYDFFAPVILLLPAEIKQRLQSVLKTRFPTHWAEIQGMAAKFAALGHPGFNEDFITIFPFYYEIGHVKLFESLVGPMCTGILSLPANKSENMRHGRNMDHTPPSARNLTLHLTVTKHGTTAFIVPGWAWITTGFSTGVIPMLGTFEMNARFGDVSMATMMDRLCDNSTVPAAIALRQLLEGGMRWSDSIHTFMYKMPRAAPIYLISSGPGRRGAILSLSVNSSDSRAEFLNDTSSVTFKVQTNYDRWLPDPPNDDRRTVAQNALTAVGRQVSGEWLGIWMALSTYPVHNVNTIFSALMTIDTDPRVYVRVPMVPKQ